MKFNTPRSIKTPIILGASSIALAITLLVGWILVLIQNSEQAEQAARANGWLMVGGIVSFVVIVVVIMWHGGGGGIGDHVSKWGGGGGDAMVEVVVAMVVTV